ncbi:acyl-ACP thioesterase [Desulfovibrio sp. OttesenSCG-928-M14]|nr:acyl-ACP thioesterase [Desulfovibrio sp. OttesenSCG-928-M14]
MRLYEDSFQTRYHEMGMDRLLRVQCLCNYFEEAAGKHAELLGVGIERLERDRLAWVLAKMRLELNRRPGPEETVRVVTWPVSVERLQFRRDLILYASGDEVLATAVTQWVIMGLDSRKLERFPLYVAEMGPDNPPLAQESGDIRIAAVPDNAIEGPLFPVRLADIDQNQHVNNGRYVDFALEAADCLGADRQYGALRRLDLIFRAEGLRGDVIASRTAAEPGAPGSFIHSLYRQSSGQELARARTVFV